MVVNRMDGIVDFSEVIRKEFLQGKPIVLIDPEREMEADFVYPAELITPEIVEFMTRYGKGLFCVVGPEKELLERGFFRLPSNYGANYFIPVDFPSTRLSTGIPAYERAVTCNKLAEAKTTLSDYKYPGHVMLIGATSFSRRRGHSESSVELVRMAGFRPYSVIVEILDENGDSHNLDFAYEIGKRFGILVLTIPDVWREYIKRTQLVKVKARASFPTKFGMFEIVSFENELDFKEHFALVKKYTETPLVRIHSECVTGDCLSSFRCDCGSQLERALEMIQKHGGILLYLRQEGRGIGLTWKIAAYELQDKGLDTYDANVQLGFKPDERDYAVAAQMLKALGVNEVKLLTNNSDKVNQLGAYGITVKERIPIVGRINKHNLKYLRTKVERFGHSINVDALENMEG